MEYLEVMSVLKEICEEHYKYGCFDHCPVGGCFIPKLANSEKILKIVKEYKAEKQQLSFFDDKGKLKARFKAKKRRK